MDEYEAAGGKAGTRPLEDRPSRARYDKARVRLETKWRRRELAADRMMRELVDVLWECFEGHPYSWIGFYLADQQGASLILGPHRDRPAQTPLPLSGVCGRALREGRSVLVPDVRALGGDYIACDPRTRSEIALPVFDEKGTAWGVLDVDSEKESAFDEMDQRWLERLLKIFSETSRPTPPNG